MSAGVRNIHKLFVGNLPWTIGNRELRQYFAKYGHVSTANVIFDKETGLSKGYGFIGFSTQGGVELILNKSHHILEGNNLIIQPTT